MKQGRIIIGVIVILAIILIIANWSKIKKYCGGGFLGYPFWGGGGCGVGGNFTPVGVWPFYNSRGCFQEGGDIAPQPTPTPQPIQVRRATPLINVATNNCSDIYNKINAESNMDRRNQLVALYNRVCGSQPQGLTGACTDWINCNPNWEDCTRSWRRCVASLGR